MPENIVWHEIFTLTIYGEHKGLLRTQDVFLTKKINSTSIHSSYYIIQNSKNKLEAEEEFYRSSIIVAAMEFRVRHNATLEHNNDPSSKHNKTHAVKSALMIGGESTFNQR